MKGGAEICRRAGIPFAKSIDDTELNLDFQYGIVHPDVIGEIMR